jgi:hypothetical protein
MQSMVKFLSTRPMIMDYTNQTEEMIWKHSFAQLTSCSPLKKKNLLILWKLVCALTVTKWCFVLGDTNSEQYFFKISRDGV